jgi:cell division protein FtsN
MSPQSDKETRQRIVERSEQLIQESRQLVEAAQAAQAAMRAKDARKHRDTLGAARERTFQANNNPPHDTVSTIPSKPPTRTNFLGQCGILLERLAPESAKPVRRG